jgi:hypothetical protein
MLDSRLSTIPENFSYALLGYNIAGEVVSSQAGRVYDTPDRSLSQLINDQSFFYGQAVINATHPTCHMTAQAGESIKGRFVYSGALWVRPDHRGSRMANVLPRISRAYALSRWGTDFTIAFLSNTNSTLFKLYGYPNVEKGVEVRGSATADMVGSLMWMNADELTEDLTRFLESAPQVNRAVSDRSGQHHSATAGAAYRHKSA